MSLFDSIKELAGNLGGDEIVANISEQLPIDGVSDAAGQVNDQASSLGDQATTQIENLKNNIGL